MAPDIVRIPDNKVDLDLDEFGHGRVVVNGLDVSRVIGSDIVLRGGQGGACQTVLTVSIPAAIVAHAEGAAVEVDEDTAAALRALGWTPPSTPCEDCGEPIQPGQECHRGHGCLQDPVAFPPPAEVSD